MRGSAKHLLDLMASDRCLDVLNELISDASASINSCDSRQPFGKETKEERRELEIPAFCAKHSAKFGDLREIQKWWLPRQADGRSRKGATWDLLSTCTIRGKSGLLLVEAKAHAKELSYSGKNLPLSASAQSKLNHDHIGRNIRDVSDRLNEIANGEYNLSIEGHYQLANRLTWAWKLADCGVPVVLLYLGFTGDTYFRSDYLKDADHWQRVMGAYLQGVVPEGLPGNPIAGKDGSTFTLLVKSRQIIELSA